MPDGKNIFDKLAEDMEKFEKENVYVKNETMLPEPISIKSVRLEIDGFCPAKQCKYVAVRLVEGNKTYLGVLIGEGGFGATCAFFNKEKSELMISERLNPIIFVPDLMKVVRGYECWWDVIRKPEDLKQITNADIQNVWYVRALKDLSKKKEHQ